MPRFLRQRAARHPVSPPTLEGHGGRNDYGGLQFVVYSYLHVVLE
jgi:hypothetical protein